MLNRFSPSFNLLWVLWFVVTLLGSTLASLAGSWGFSGLLIGIGQWAILRTRLHKTWLWIPATAVGIPLGLVIGVIDLSVLSLTIDFQYAWIGFLLMASLAGTIIGGLQWLALYRSLDGASRWVFVSVLSWGIGITLALYIFSAYYDGGLDLGFGILIGAVVGAISGAFVESTLINPDLKPESNEFPSKPAS